MSYKELQKNTTVQTSAAYSCLYNTHDNYSKIMNDKGKRDIYIYTHQFYFLPHSFLLVEQLPISSTAATAVAIKEEKQLLRFFSLENGCVLREQGLPIC